MPFPTSLKFKNRQFFDCLCAVGQTSREEFRTRQKQYQHLYSWSPKVVWYWLQTSKIRSAYRKSRMPSSEHPPLVTPRVALFGFYLWHSLGQRGKEPSLRPQASSGKGNKLQLERSCWPGAGGGARLGSGASCTQMRRARTRSVLEGKGAGTESPLTSPLHDTGGEHCPQPSQRGHATALRAGLQLAHHGGLTVADFNSTPGNNSGAWLRKCNSFQSETAGKGLSRQMVNCSNWN